MSIRFWIGFTCLHNWLIIAWSYLGKIILFWLVMHLIYILYILIEQKEILPFPRKSVVISILGKKIEKGLRKSPMENYKTGSTSNSLRCMYRKHPPCGHHAWLQWKAPFIYWGYDSHMLPSHWYPLSGSCIKNYICCILF